LKTLGPLVGSVADDSTGVVPDRTGVSGDLADVADDTERTP
jgi:hypothetical protein